MSNVEPTAFSSPGSTCLVQKGQRCESVIFSHHESQWYNDPFPYLWAHRSASKPPQMCLRFSSSLRRRSYSLWSQNNKRKSLTLATTHQTQHTPVLISSLYYHITPHIIPLSSDLYILSRNIWLASVYVNVPMKPASFHLLCVVLHVALQSDTLWCALKNQVRGRGTCNQTHKTFKLQ